MNRKDILRKVLLFCLVGALALGMTPLGAFAEGEGEGDGAANAAATGIGAADAADGETGAANAAGKKMLTNPDSRAILSVM